MVAASGPEGVHRYVPAHFDNPFGLALRLLRTRDADAYWAMGQAALGAALAPIDRRLEPGELRLYAAAAAPDQPLLFVCGPPRSGTTLLTQALIATLPVGYLPNLTAIFPRAPLTAMARFGPRLSSWRPRFRSFFGRMPGLMAPNDALELWDRWLGSDRRGIRTALGPAEREAMSRFFGAAAGLLGRPLVAKNNSLNAHAALVGDALPAARFVCLTREPVALAMAFLRARKVINGDTRRPYGLAEPEGVGREDPLVSVCRQVRFHARLAEAQRAQLGPGRFEVVSYEAFCRDPAAVIGTVAERLGVPIQPDRLAHLPPFRVSQETMAAPAVRERIAALLAGSAPA